eukprot:TRINITY_DN4105_c0_g1_i1.p1 TRINITY_DN4105_c0_g1~~TRINITY_DN4105_c0_g1_i1.p1  ORF type:complete len:320 (-),score=156.48 TRINITY_DN4105_c0_g1_i1:90-980(-)
MFRTITTASARVAIRCLPSSVSVGCQRASFGSKKIVDPFEESTKEFNKFEDKFFNESKDEKKDRKKQEKETKKHEKEMKKKHEKETESSEHPSASHTISAKEYQSQQNEHPKGVVNPSTLEISEEAKMIARGLKPGYDSGLGGSTDRDARNAQLQDGIEDREEDLLHGNHDKNMFRSQELMTCSEAVSDLNARGYTEKFELSDNKICLHRLSKKFDIDQIRLQEVFRFDSEAKSDDTDHDQDQSVVVFGLEAVSDEGRNHAYKGVLQCKYDKFRSSKIGDFVAKISESNKGYEKSH